MKITSVDVSGFGPFGSNVIFHFNPTITFVVGDHGTGKSTLAAAIKDELTGKLREPQVSKFNANSIPLMVIDERSQFPAIGVPWNEGLIIWNDLVKDVTMPSALVSRFQFLLREIMREKLSCSSKFSGVVFSPADISASISDDFCINIRHTDTEKDLNWGFQAFGEKTALFIALVQAIRDFFPHGSQLPLIWDDFGGPLDRTLLPSCFNALGNMQGQVILLMQRNVADTLGVKADIDLSWKEGPDGNYLKAWQATTHGL